LAGLKADAPFAVLIGFLTIEQLAAAWEVSGRRTPIL